jgi:raffinose/stachyose/melibiose transport system permease protein
MTKGKMPSEIVEDSKKSTWWSRILSVIIVLSFVLPIYVLLSMSFKNSTDFTSRLSLPKYFYPDNYITILKSGTIFRAYINTLIIAGGTIGVEVVFGCMAAYALARNQSRFNEIIRNFVLSVMIIPALSVLVGVYSLIVAIHGISTHWALIAVSSAFGLPMSIYMFTNFIVNIPRALDEAATIDGASTFQTFWYIILPQLKPVTATVVILKGISAWNDYLYPTYFLQKKEMYTVVLMIKQYFSATNVDLHGAAAAAILGMLPVIILYLSLQKYFIQGTLDSAVK